MQNPIKTLSSEEEITAFFRNKPEESVRVVGFMYDDERDPDSDWEQFEVAARNMANWVNVSFGRVEDRELIKKLRAEGAWIQQLDVVKLSRTKGKYKNLELAYRHDKTIYPWIVSNSLQMVEQLGAFNFQYYKATNLPMLIMFLDAQNMNHDAHLDIFKQVAEKWEDDIKFGWMDTQDPMVAAKKSSIGLVTEILPAIAFNLQEDRQLAFDEGKPITYDNLMIFVQDFKENRVGQFINKASHSIDPKLEASLANVIKITREDYEELVYTEGTDVLVLFYSTFNN